MGSSCFIRAASSAWSCARNEKETAPSSPSSCRGRKTKERKEPIRCAFVRNPPIDVWGEAALAAPRQIKQINMSAETLTLFDEAVPHSSIRPNAPLPDAAGPEPRGVVAAGRLAPVDAAIGQVLDGTVLDGKYRIERKIGEGA